MYFTNDLSLKRLRKNPKSVSENINLLSTNSFYPNGRFRKNIQRF